MASLAFFSNERPVLLADLGSCKHCRAGNYVPGRTMTGDTPCPFDGDQGGAAEQYQQEKFVAHMCGHREKDG
jgi:hypothetical protein